MTAWSSAFACPTCRAALAPAAPSPSSEAQRRCAACDVTYASTDGIWRMMPPARLEAYRKFVEQYETVRSAEGRRARSADQLRALPFRDLSRKRRYEWSIRARSFRTLIDEVVEPLEATSRGTLRILDIGSGLGWLSHRLSLRGHELAAVDLVTNDFDGLGVHRHYGDRFVAVQAEFDHLPFASGSADLAVYNASFHYAPDYVSALREALRVLDAGGRVVVMDTPIYRDASSGRAMVREREDAFEKRYGFRGDAVACEGFLTYARLEDLADRLDLRWRL
ncbi:MAG TPA: class I SAM-dependent methyltransferase, partial [Polyangiaceae bacterium]|nr:class I SAM-dependent methyltransferase [Polyangiaceae bacterium]